MATRLDRIERRLAQIERRLARLDRGSPEPEPDIEAALAAGEVTDEDLRAGTLTLEDLKRLKLII